jgi:hypothetical protein
MAKDPQKPTPRSLLTGTAQSVTNSVERASGFLKDRPETSKPPSQRRSFSRKKRPEVDGVEEPTAEPRANKAEVNGEEEGEV